MGDKEIVVEFGEGWWVTLVPVLVLAILGLTLLGRQVTGEDTGILTPDKWRLHKAERAFVRESNLLRLDAEELAEILNSRPDPVRAGLTAERIGQDVLEGEPALALQREAMANAAELVRLWAMGGALREDAEAALSYAAELLEGER